MVAGTRGTGWGPEYHITATFRVPLDFAFAWCTDYTPEDAGLEGEAYQRKIIERSARRVVFEDLEEMPGPKQLTKAQREESARVAWKRFGTAMKRDYRRSRSSGTRQTK